jgi:hypothetical protein
MRWLSSIYMTLRDVGEERGWLLNGTSRLLHLVRGSLERDKSDLALRSVLLLKTDDLEEASMAHHPESALEVLLSLSNLKLRLYHVDADVTFKDRVEDYYDQLEKMYDHQVSGLRKKRGSPRSLLEGWDFQDMVHERDPIHPRHTTLSQDGCSWIDFTRSLSTITLFGRDFGEILRPLGACAELSTSKPERSTFAAIMLDLNNIMTSKGDAYCTPMKLTQDIIWHIPEGVFDSCLSDEPGHEHRSHAVLSLLPSSIRRELPEAPSSISFNSGAVILGFNRQNKWFWGESGLPSKVTIPLECKAVDRTGGSVDSIDSGLGRSLGTSADGETELSTSSDLRALKGV